ncbi:6-phosphofructokinase [Striga asiatica]|uniref:6-phosphofructokinase n=1 Tax=Striga asiatica TaxID=4170 RepID=A0A5A7PE62_STRAF|nr:6-phosphofructokinase [Striga asiatica]
MEAPVELSETQEGTVNMLLSIDYGTINELTLIFTDSTQLSSHRTRQLLVTPGGTKYWIPQCEDALRPFKGQIFHGLGEAVIFYNTYASTVGFDVRHNTFIKAIDKTYVRERATSIMQTQSKQCTHEDAGYPTEWGVTPGLSFELTDQTAILFDFLKKSTAIR